MPDQDGSIPAQGRLESDDPPPNSASWVSSTTSSAAETEEGFQVVLLIHGIRTQAEWGPMVRSKLEIPGRIEVIPIRYGYFDAFRFWFPFWTRNAPVEKVYLQIRVALQKYRKVHPDTRLSVIAHSFGTYVVGRILKRDFDLTIHRLILCGSVLPQDFSWHQCQGRFDDEKVINECGKADIWPVLAHSTSWGYGVSGTHGFGVVLVKDRYHEGGHGQYFDPKFVETYWEPLIRRGEYRSTNFEVKMPPTPWWISVLGILPLRSLVLVIILAISFGFAGLVAPWRNASDTRRADLPPIAGQWIAFTPEGQRLTQIMGEGTWDPATGRLRGAYTLIDSRATGNGTYELVPLPDHKASFITSVPERNFADRQDVMFEGDGIMYSTLRNGKTLKYIRTQ